MGLLILRVLENKIESWTTVVVYVNKQSQQMRGLRTGAPSKFIWSREYCRESLGWELRKTDCGHTSHDVDLFK